MCHVAREVLFPKLSLLLILSQYPQDKELANVIFSGQFLEKCGLIFAGWLTRKGVGSCSPTVGDWEATKRFFPHEHTADHLFWAVLLSLVHLLWL